MKKKDLSGLVVDFAVNDTLLKYKSVTSHSFTVLCGSIAETNSDI